MEKFISVNVKEMENFSISGETLAGPAIKRSNISLCSFPFYGMHDSSKLKFDLEARDKLILS